MKKILKRIFCKSTNSQNKTEDSMNDYEKIRAKFLTAIQIRKKNDEDYQREQDETIPQIYEDTVQKMLIYYGSPKRYNHRKYSSLDREYELFVEGKVRCKKLAVLFKKNGFVIKVQFDVQCDLHRITFDFS